MYWGALRCAKFVRPSTGRVGSVAGDAQSVDKQASPPAECNDALVFGTKPSAGQLITYKIVLAVIKVVTNGFSDRIYS